jgi:hypothetical protein
VDGPPAGADRQQIMQFMTTEHFTLQTARAVVNAEISARLQLYMTTLSSAIIALALVAQVSGALGRAFETFALVLLPVVYFLGLATLTRLLQAAAEWGTYGHGMNRIRHWYLEVAPEMAPYFVLPATDDPWASLAAVGIRRNNTWQGRSPPPPGSSWSSTVSWPASSPGSWPAWPGRPARSSSRSPERSGSWSAWPPSASTSSGSSAATWTPARWPSRPRPASRPAPTAAARTGPPAAAPPARPRAARSAPSVSDREKPAGSLVEADSR